MKRIYIILLCLVSYTVADAQLYKGYKGTVVSTCNSLAERDEVLYLDMKIEIDKEAISTCQSWTIIPELVASAVNRKEFPSILIQGENKRRMYVRKEAYGSKEWNTYKPYQLVNIKKNIPSSRILQYKMEIPYEPWMDNARLVFRQILTSCAGNRQLFVVNLDKGVTLQPRIPYEPKPVVAFAQPEKELVKSRKIQAQAYLDFPSGRSVIVPTFRRNPEELSKIQQTLRGVQENANVNITGLFIEGYASPEGTYAINARLAAERAEALKNHIGNNFGVNKSIITATSTAEDWDGLKILVEASEIPNKEAILAIIDSDLAPDVKEVRIKGYSTQYRLMLTEMFPQLRRSDYRVDFTVKDFNLTESKDILEKDPSLLSHHELYTLANSYKIGSKEFDKVYEYITRLFPDDEVAITNNSAMMFMHGEYTGAKRRLEALPTLNAQGLNTLGAIYLKEGDLDKAAALFTQARTMGSRVAATNLQEVEKKREDNVKMERYKNRK